MGQQWAALSPEEKRVWTARVAAARYRRSNRASGDTGTESDESDSEEEEPERPVPYCWGAAVMVPAGNDRSMFASRYGY